jgi:glycosyltransferase involved in cell wall biosynthesis
MARKSARMRVLQIVSQTRVGGAENFALQLAEALIARGHSVRLLATRANGDLFDAAGPRLSRAACPRRSRWDPRLPAFLAREIRDFRPEIIHAHNFGPNTWSRTAALFFPSARIVCHAHSGRATHDSAWRLWLERALNHRTGLLICVSQPIEASFRKARLIRPERIRTVPVGIDTGPFQAARGDESILPPGARGRPRVLHIASFTPVKNHALLLDAFARVATRTDAALLFAGDGPLRPRIEEKISCLRLSDRVFLLGERRDIPKLLSLASLSVLPSLAEGLPLAILESMAAAVCPVASRVGGIPNVVHEGRTGYLVPAGSEEALAETLLRALRDPERLTAMGRAARQYVEEHYSIRVIAARIERCYEEVLAR